MEIINVNLAANETKQFRRGGVGLEILSSTYAVNINTYSQLGGQVNTMQGALAGLFISSEFGGFDLQNGSGIGQTVQLLILDKGEGGGSRRVALQGALSVGSIPAPQCDTANTAPTVNVGSSTILAAKPTRQYLLIQNNHATADLWIRTDGGAAAVGAGIKVGPGLPYEPSVVPRGQVNAYSTAAGNVVSVTEG